MYSQLFRLVLVLQTYLQMYAFSSLFLIAAVAVSVDASNFLKRQSPAQQCSANVQNLNTVITNYNELLAGYQGEAAESMDLPLGDMFQDVTNRFSSSNEICCAIPNETGTVDSNTIFEIMTAFAPNIQKISETLVSKEATFKSSASMYKSIEDVVVALKEPTVTLTHCLFEKIPEANKDQANTQADAILKSVSDAQNAYGFTL